MIIVSLYICLSLCVCVHTRTQGCGGQSQPGCHFSRAFHFLFEIGSITGTQGLLIWLRYWPAKPKNLPVSAPPVLGFWVCDTMPVLFGGSGNLNTDPHTCMVSILQMESEPQLPTIGSECVMYTALNLRGTWGNKQTVKVALGNNAEYSVRQKTIGTVINTVI